MIGQSFDGQIRWSDIFLKENADVLGELARGECGDVLTVEQDATCLGDELAGQGLEECAFAGAVRADECGDFTGRNVERYFVEDQRLLALVTHAQAFANESGGWCGGWVHSLPISRRCLIR